MAENEFEKGVKTIEAKLSKVKLRQKGRFLTKAKAKGPQPISAKKTLKRFAHESGPLVREVEPKEFVRDDRSQFFTREFEREERSLNKWLG